MDLKASTLTPQETARNQEQMRGRTFFSAQLAPPDLPLVRGGHALQGQVVHGAEGAQALVADHVGPAVHEHLRLGCHFHLLHLIAGILHTVWYVSLYVIWSLSGCCRVLTALRIGIQVVTDRPAGPTVHECLRLGCHLHLLHLIADILHTVRLGEPACT